MINTSDFRRGMNIILDNDIYTIVEFQHHKPGKGGAVMRTKLKSLTSGVIVNKTFRAGEKFEQAIIEFSKKQYLYSSADTYTFMDIETYEQINISADLIGDRVKYMKEGLEVNILTHKEKIIGVELPNSVELKVEYTEPGLKGNTASSTTKSAKLETGLDIQVPLFIDIDDIIRVDTRTGEYLARV